MGRSYRIFLKNFFRREKHFEVVKHFEHEDEMFDYAWIESKNNGEIVWKMLARNTDWAGGAEKNRKIKTELYLPPGRYLLHYRSDGSHSFEDWNDDPPKDFRNYGVSIKIEKAN